MYVLPMRSFSAICDTCTVVTRNQYTSQRTTIREIVDYLLFK